MAQIEIWQFLSARADESYTNKQLSLLFGLGISTVNRVTKKLSKSGVISFDLQYHRESNFHQTRYYFCNPKRKPVIMRDNVVECEMDVMDNLKLRARKMNQQWSIITQFNVHDTHKFKKQNDNDGTQGYSPQ